jgi:hypothetical protein
MELSKQHKHYIDLIQDWFKNKNFDKKYQIFEYLYALKLNLVTWDDMTISDIIELPNKKDYGIDLISIDNKITCQVKDYASNSYINYSDISNFYTLSKEFFNIKNSNMILATTKESKIVPHVQSMIDKGTIKLKRKNFNDLLNKYVKIDLDIDNYDNKSTKKEIEKRHYLLKCFEIVKNTNNKSLNLQLPCGTGKSYIMLYIILEDLKDNQNNKHIILCPWKDLSYQLIKLFQQFNISVCLIGDNNHNYNQESVIICINGSLKSHLPKQRYKYIFIDEAHHLENDNETRNEINKFKSQIEINFSATFYDQTNLDYKYSIEEAVNDGYITDYKFYIEYFSEGRKLNALAKILSERKKLFPAFIYFNDTKKAKGFEIG